MVLCTSSSLRLNTLEIQPILTLYLSETQICFGVAFDRLEIKFRTMSYSPSPSVCPHKLGDPQRRCVDLSRKESSSSAAINEVLK